MQNMKEKIANADLVLIGIGEEFEIKTSEIQKEDGEAAVFKRKQAYCQLKELVKDKNYFIVTLCMDGIIHEAEFDKNRIVEPCGSYYRLQCSNKCTPNIYKPDKEQTIKIHEYIEGKCEEKDINLPVCPKCNAPLVFNTIQTENYAEEGYLNMWQTYNKWLQGTVNKKLCILELGVGMRFPTVIRWAFEKVAYFNQKAVFFRVHSKLFQTTEEIKERSVGIQSDPMDFLKELSNQI